jgi:hypothetical protein
MSVTSIPSPKKISTVRDHMIQCFSCPELTGKFRFDQIDSLDQIQVHLFHDDVIYSIFREFAKLY